MNEYYDFLEKAKSKLTAASDTVGKMCENAVKKTEKFCDQTKLRFCISETENEIKKQYQILGEIAYLAGRGGETKDELVQGVIETIDRLHLHVAELTERLNAVV